MEIGKAIVYSIKGIRRHWLVYGAKNKARHCEKKVKNRTAKERVRLTNCYYSQLPLEARRTMTYNNSLEFSAHEEISSALGTKIYFARPSASFKRGRNENSNGLIRWYLSKDTDLDSLTEEELDAIIKLINDRRENVLTGKHRKKQITEEMSKLIKQRANDLLTNHSATLVS